MKTLAVVLLTLVAPLLGAQHASYADLKDRAIKALSEQDVRNYREGAGMGFALAAELNQYPGPKHVLELGEQLALSAEQREKVQGIFDAMHAEAVHLGAQIVEKESALDAAFASEAIEPDSLHAMTASIAKLQGELRFVHLRAHLQTRVVLTRHQRMMYGQLRGYGGHAH